ncbi:putative transporter [Dysgonomonas sp. 216]|uniref:putative transporter n=1 Tax=Dysgonomonas sp. 216 TaxID=2302934 RepID=UPI0013D32E77|nr:putative transporter [Dysgonomonas sp. 216]NDW17314.1 putative transporter [Dysgonomonas sp. 216]
MFSFLDYISLPSIIQPIVIILTVAFVGLLFGKIKILNISLGITFVFFAGIVVGHFGLDINKDILHFCQNFGLIIFVYALGLQVGPGFFSSFKKGGLQLNMLSLMVIIAGLILALLFHFICDISLPNMIGILSGAVTNTPMLGAAQETLRQIVPNDSKIVTEMASACAVAYPFGVIGVIIAIAVMYYMSGQRDENKNGARKNKKDSSTYIGEYQIINPAVAGKTIKDIMPLSPKKFVISRVWKDGKVTIPTSETELSLNDHLLIISKKSDIEHIKVLFGEQENVDWNKEDIDWNHIDNSHLVSRRILVTHSKVNGVKLGALKLRNLYGINITRINRAGIDLLPSPNLSLQIGDRITVVGELASIDNVAKTLGNEVKRLKNPNLIAIFLGVILGVILGAIPIPFLNLTVPVKLGIAGGPIIVGILMGAFGHRFHITTYTTQSANLMLRQFGITVYLACLGLDAGEHFFETVLGSDGFLWIGLGFILTIVPVTLVGWLAAKIMKIDYAECAGMLCGSMANPMALSYANSTVDGDEPSAAYATVYPASMFIRLITVQIILILFF